jgi:hypothetical protein
MSKLASFLTSLHAKEKPCPSRRRREAFTPGCSSTRQPRAAAISTPPAARSSAGWRWSTAPTPRSSAPGRGQVDLLVVDLERFDPELDHAGLARLVAARAGAPVFVLCPFANARWLAALMACGPVEYAITPLPDAALQQAIGARLAAGPTAVAPPTSRANARWPSCRRCAAGARGARPGRGTRGAGRAPVPALCGWPGVAHAALFHLQPGGDLQLAGPAWGEGQRGLNLARLLGRAERLLQSPLRHAFPGLLAAAGNTVALLDDPKNRASRRWPKRCATRHRDGAGAADPVQRAGRAARFALPVFRAARSFSRLELDALAELADLAAIGLRMADLNRESEEMLVRVTHLATLDALTAVANRRHGEALLERKSSARAATSCRWR